MGKNAYPVNRTFINIGGILFPPTHNFVVKSQSGNLTQKRLLRIKNKFVIREPPPSNGFIFEFYNQTGNANIVSAGWSSILENAMTASGQIWTAQDAWQAAQLEVRINMAETHWRWDYFPHGNMQYHNVYSTISGAGNKTWITGVPSIQQEARGQPSKVNGLAWDVIYSHPGLLADGMWHEMPVSFPFPHLQWREQSGRPDNGNKERNDVWFWNIDHHCECRWWDDITCTCVLYPDYICWLRGDDESRLSRAYREMSIDNALFPPSTQGWSWNPTRSTWESNRTLGVRRISLEHWQRPWERYPHLL